MYINIDGKYFKDVSDLLVDAGKGYGFGGVFTDFDNDNDLDLFIINDFGRLMNLIDYWLTNTQSSDLKIKA